MLAAVLGAGAGHSSSMPPVTAGGVLVRDAHAGEIRILDFATKKNFRSSQWEAELELVRDLDID